MSASKSGPGCFNFSRLLKWILLQKKISVSRTQMDLRRRVFEHAIRLPLHRVHQIKSGGVAGILREDAGGVADLLFQMLYNPCNAITQLTLTLSILGFVRWQSMQVCVLTTQWKVYLPEFSFLSSEF